VSCPLSAEVKRTEKEAKFYVLRSETEGFISFVSFQVKQIFHMQNGMEKSEDNQKLNEAKRNKTKQAEK
jgi:hypothetical protein